MFTYPSLFRSLLFEIKFLRPKTCNFITIMNIYSQIVICRDYLNLTRDYLSCKCYKALNIIIDLKNWTVHVMIIYTYILSCIVYTFLSKAITISICYFIIYTHIILHVLHKKTFNLSQERQHNILINGKDTGTNGLSLFTYPQI